MKRTSSDQLCGTHRQVCLLISILFKKWVWKILRSLLTSMSCWLNASVQLCAASAITDQSHVALEVGPAGLSVAQKHQCRLVMDLTSSLTAWSLFAKSLTVGNLS